MTTKRLNRDEAVEEMVKYIDYQMEVSDIISYSSMIIGMGDEWDNFFEDDYKTNDINIVIDIIHEAVKKLNLVSFYVFGGSQKEHRDGIGREWYVIKRLHIGVVNYFNVNLTNYARYE